MEVKPGYKQTDAGVIPDDWDVKPIREIAEVKGGKRLPLGKSLTDALTPHAYIRVTDMYPGGVNLDNIKYVPENAFPAIKNYRISSDDIFISVAGTLGIAGKVPKALDGANLTENADKITAIKCERDYLLCNLTSYRIQNSIVSQQTQGAQPKLALNRIEGFVVALPPLPEQRAIAASLSDVDALLAAQDKLITKKRSIKQAAMHELLTGKRRLPGFAGAWEETTIGAFTDCTAGGTPSTAIPTYWGGSIRWMSSGELNMKIVKEVVGRITEAGLKNSSTKLIPAKCVLIGLAGQGKTRGTVAMNLVELCTNQSIASIYPNSTFVPEYLYYNLDNRYDELRGLSTGDGGRGGLNLTIIKSVNVQMPTIKEQRAIATVLSDMDAEIASLTQKRAKTRLLKQGMMQELLTGKTRLV